MPEATTDVGEGREQDAEASLIDTLRNLSITPCESRHTGTDRHLRMPTYVAYMDLGLRGG
jgi:hypothetical protein